MNKTKIARKALRIIFKISVNMTDNLLLKKVQNI